MKCELCGGLVPTDAPANKCRHHTHASALNGDVALSPSSKKKPTPQG